MARQPRIVFPDAVYHVIGRGNYRKNLFDGPAAAGAFLHTLFTVCRERGWTVQAYAVLSNHYHLCLQTPDADLPEGMQRVLSAFAARFNRLRGQQGHVFQGRYKSLVVEPGASLLRVVDYIHLNPVRAGIVPFDALASHPRCSYAAYAGETEPDALNGALWREYAHFTGNDGWRRYDRHLRNKWEHYPALTPAQRRREDNLCCRGWCVATERYRQFLLTQFKPDVRNIMNNHTDIADDTSQMELFRAEG